MFDGGGMSSTAFILSGFASIPRLLTIKPKNFPAETLSHPDSRSDPNGGSELGSGRETIYWDSLLTFSDIGGPKSCNRIKISYTKFQNKTATVVVFTVSYTYSFESHLHIKNYTLHLHDQSTEPTVMNPYSCAGLAECRRSLSPSSVPTRIEKPVLSFTLSGKHR